MKQVKLVAASVDVGKSGMPGTEASEITCRILVSQGGKWEATGYFSTGCNQGYYQERIVHRR